MLQENSPNSPILLYCDFCNYTCNKKSDMTKHNSKYISFSLSLLAQRTSEVQKARKYDLVSTLFGQENLVSLERYLNFALKISNSFSILEHLKCDSNFNSYQEKILLSKIGYLKTNLQDINSDNETVLTW